MASDVRTVKYYGLRSAEAFFEAGTTYFGRICWSFGEVPFDDATFDIVFCQNAFQYVQDLPVVTQEIHRVLKPGGRLVLAWTGVKTPFKSDRWGPGHTLEAYRRCIRAAGFSTHFFPPRRLYESIRSISAGRHSIFTVAASVLSMIWRWRPGLLSMFLRLGGIAATVAFGVPINLIAVRNG